MANSLLFANSFIAKDIYFVRIVLRVLCIGSLTPWIYNRHIFSFYHSTSLQWTNSAVFNLIQNTEISGKSDIVTL